MCILVSDITAAARECEGHINAIPIRFIQCKYVQVCSVMNVPASSTISTNQPTDLGLARTHPHVTYGAEHRGHITYHTTHR